MSLKALHIVFVTASMLLCVVFGVWALNAYRDEGGATELWYAIGAGVLFVVLAVYGWFFLKKLKSVSYL